MLSRRLTYGPILIAAMLGLAWLDELLAGRRLPPALSWLTGEGGTAPPGTVIFIASAALLVLAARELAAMLRSRNVRAGNRVTIIAALLGFSVSVIAPASMPGDEAAMLIATTGVAALLIAVIAYARHQT
ncbi:MAG: hypothetical protein VYC34_10665, partial [Planctomycetota bacterium]|nr:hypothetical protein [Planctomycetota bacterium]